MIQEQYISFQTAKLAKEKKVFIEGCCEVYSQEGVAARTPNGGKWNWEEYEKGEFCLRITQSLLARWLREKHNIHVGVGFCVSWRYIIIPITDKITADWSTSKKDYSTYEDAMEEGLKDTLKHI